MPETSTTLFFATLAVTAVIARYFLSSHSSHPPDAPSTPRSPPREVTEDLVEIVKILVPHVDRRVIRADLEESRNVEVTVQRLSASLSSDTSREPFRPVTDEEVLARTEEPKPSNWIDDRQEREKHMRQQREKMIAKARLRTRQLQSQE